MNQPIGIDLDQYKARAKDLLKEARVGHAEAIERIRNQHPDHRLLIETGKLKLSDAQLVVARENGFPSWTKFSHYLWFRHAVQALDRGDVDGLRELLDARPWLTRYRCFTGEWYEQGYFAGATLLNHIAGNPIRVPIPPNIVTITQLLLSRDFEPKAAQYTVELLLTSKQASEAGVAIALIDLLISAGVEVKLDQPEVLTFPLLNAAPATAIALLGRGAKLDVRHAAALGELPRLRELLKADPGSDLLEEALAFACIRGQREAARLLIEQGAHGDVLVRPGGQTSRTALHEAANRGFEEIVDDLLVGGASPDVRDERWNGTAAGWANAGGHQALAERLGALEGTKRTEGR